MVSDLPPTASPIQLGTEGKFEGDAFVVVGRIVYQYERGGWNEWYLRTMRGAQRVALRRAGRSRDLHAGEDSRRAPRGRRAEGRPVVRDRRHPLPRRVDHRARATPASRASCRSRRGTAASRCSPTSTPTATGEQLRFATIDYSDDTPVAYVGTYVELEQLAARNLRQLRGLVSAPAVASLELPAVRRGDRAPHARSGAVRRLLELRQHPRRARSQPRAHPGVPGEAEVHAADPARHTRHAQGREVGGRRLPGAQHHRRRHRRTTGTSTCCSIRTRASATSPSTTATGTTCRS